MLAINILIQHSYEGHSQGQKESKTITRKTTEEIKNKK